MSAPSTFDLLIVEDDDPFREMAFDWMQRKGHAVEAAADVAEALQRLERKQFDVVLADLNMPGASGMDLLARLKADGAESEIVIMTGQATVRTAVEAMKLGACDYLTKPFSLSELEHRLEQAAERGRLRRQNASLKALIERQRPSDAMVGESPAMKEVFRLIERVGPTDKSVLIQGESGTGKELVAQAIQRASALSEAPFVTINCAALPEPLVESELFGHEKGAFTGAIAAKRGLFEMADGGTLFIDEIGEMPVSLQPKLLRVLEDGSLRRVGSALERKVKTRVIAATNRELEREVARKAFREDLYYRINVMSLRLPPLRERMEDLGPLVARFLPDGWSVAEDAFEALREYSWPGNVRQLKNVIERGTILADDRRLKRADLPPEIAARTGSRALGRLGQAPAARSTLAAESTKDGEPRDANLAEMQKAHVLETLRASRGNKTRAARALGIHRRQLYRLLERFGEGNLDSPEFDRDSYSSGEPSPPDSDAEKVPETGFEPPLCG